MHMPCYVCPTQEFAPLLYDFIVGELEGRDGLPAAAVRLISEALDIAKSCYIPAGVGAYERATVKRATAEKVAEKAPGEHSLSMH